MKLPLLLLLLSVTHKLPHLRPQGCNNQMRVLPIPSHLCFSTEHSIDSLCFKCAEPPPLSLSYPIASSCHSWSSSKGKHLVKHFCISSDFNPPALVYHQLKSIICLSQSLELAYLSPKRVHAPNGHARQFIDLWDEYTKTFCLTKKCFNLINNLRVYFVSVSVPYDSPVEEVPFRKSYIMWKGGHVLLREYSHVLCFWGSI